MRISDQEEEEAKVIVTNALCLDVDDLSLSSYDAGHTSLRRVSFEAEEETLAVLTELDNLRIKATFFVQGYVAKESPELVRAIDGVIGLLLQTYIKNVLWSLSPAKQRPAIYDQPNPSFPRCYRKE